MDGGVAKVLIPSCTVPTCSNSEANSHMTQCETPFKRNAMAVAAATPPNPTCPADHSHNAVPKQPRMSSMPSVWFTTSKPLILRICWCTVPRNSCMPPRA